MFPVIRNGFASTLDMFTAWWRGSGHSRPPPPVVRPPAGKQDGPEHGANLVLTEEALRRALSFALDGNCADPVEDDEANHKPLIAAASAALATLEVQARYLPRRPSLLPKLMSAINSDSNSMQELASIIGGDPTLMGNLMRVANSAFYRVSDKPIESLDRAVIRVGTDGIRSLVATALLHPVMSKGSGDFAGFPEAIWEQTQYAADAAELHAKRIERSDAFAARLLALLHGLAINTVFRIVRDEARTRGEGNIKAAMMQLIGMWTAPVSRRIAANWELPAEMQQALESSSLENPVTRSGDFGWLAGSQLLMVKRGQIEEAAARDTVLAADPRRVQVDHVWNRLVVAFLRPH